MLASAALGGIFALNGNPQDRVKRAYQRAGTRVQRIVSEAGIPYPPKILFIRAFKSEKELEIWGSVNRGAKFELIQKYKIEMMSGKLGPKRREGDLQVPEGIYYIDRFNPQSKFHLSLGINYPNASDIKRSDRERPGGDIFIHGSNQSIGCLAMTDVKIEEIYILALEAKNSGQTKIPVHIFPFRLTTENLRRHRTNNPESAQFWEELKPFYECFETQKLVPEFSIDRNGAYVLKRT